MTKDLPENLRKLRLQANYSQEYVAEKMGISLTTYSRVERGVSAIDFEYIVKAAQLYKMTLDEIYNYGDPQFQKSKNVKAEYLRRWSVPITVSLDGTAETLQMWTDKLKEINRAI